MVRPVFAVFGLLALAACGGTSSETPWPVEPDDVIDQPLGESADPGRPIDVNESGDPERVQRVPEPGEGDIQVELEGAEGTTDVAEPPATPAMPTSKPKAPASPSLRP